MPRFQYKLTDDQGMARSGDLVAVDRRGAELELISKFGGEIHNLREIESADVKVPLTKAASDELATQLANLTVSDLPLEAGLQRLGDDLGRYQVLSGLKTRRNLYRLSDQLSRGVPLDTVLEKQGAAEDLVAAIRAGIRSGNTGRALTQYVAQVKTLGSLRSRITIAFVYPVGLFIFSTALFVTMMIYIVPQFSDMFSGFGIELPIQTLIVISLADLLQNYLVTLLLCVGLGLALIMFALQFVSPYRRRSLQISVPVFGTILQCIALSRFAHTLAFLVENEVHLPEALLIAGRGSRDAVVERVAKEWASLMEQGESLTHAAQRVGGIPGQLFESIHWQQQGELLALTLHSIGDMYEGRARSLSSTLIAFAEPVIVATIGIAFCFVVASLFFPLIMLMNDLS